MDRKSFTGDMEPIETKQKVLAENMNLQKTYPNISRILLDILWGVFFWMEKLDSDEVVLPGFLFVDILIYMLDLLDNISAKHRETT